MKFFTTLFLLLLLAWPAPAAAQTRDSWRSVRTNNLLVIGNADPEKLRQVAVWLEFFHSAFGRLVSHNVLDGSVPTRVVVFRDDASFNPFKPLYQGRTANLSGFFQPGEDVNYIALSLDPRERDPYSVAFHEYVHLHLRDNVPQAPVWLNEGLAEFYGHLQFSGGEAVLGVPLPYLHLLRSQELLPLTTLLSIDHNSPHYNEQDKTGIFYGESWALVHYLMLGGGGRQDQFRRFLQQVSRGEDVAKSLENSFGMTLETIEKELRAYISHGELPTLRLASADDPQAYASFTAMQRQSLSDAEANYYLGDLLLHIGRNDDAERYFKQAIALDPNLTLAYAALGQLSLRQKRYAEAKKYLERAVTSPQNYLVHYHYAWLLSRETIFTGGRTTTSPEAAAAIREQLARTIKLAPDFAPAYYLSGLVDVARDERLDEALDMARKAHRLEPAKASYTLLLAEVYARRADAASARELAEPLARDADAAVREEAQDVLDALSGRPANRPGGDSRATVSSALIAEPVQPGTARISSGGGSNGGTTAIRDGQTIDNSGSLPTIDEVLARYVEAVGGEKVITAVTSRVTKGTVDVAGMSRGGTYECYQRGSNKLYTIMDAHPFGLNRTGYNGRVVWSWTKAGTQILGRPEEVAQFAREADLYMPVGLKGKYAKVTLAGRSQIGYRDVYVLELQPATGDPQRLYLDAKTYLPVRMNRVQRFGNLVAAVEIYLDDWRAVDGIQLPFSVSVSSPNVSLSFTITEIRHNVPIDASLFEPPKR
ncbi:MAG TPA: tetratricopeptide repeat protein [Pyrinomonadaceae bacterium]|nr:tetratricopeptide repeat protein [Pyrinomonadaceae bacterium]